MSVVVLPSSFLTHICDTKSRAVQHPGSLSRQQESDCGVHTGLQPCTARGSGALHRRVQGRNCRAKARHRFRMGQHFRPRGPRPTLFANGDGRKERPVTSWKSGPKAGRVFGTQSGGTAKTAREEGWGRAGTSGFDIQAASAGKRKASR